jgi:hypothetical protein
MDRSNTSSLLIDCLSPELICRVGHLLPGVDVQHFRLTCRLVNHVLRADAYNMAWPPVVFAGSVDDLLEGVPWSIDTLTLTSPRAVPMSVMGRMHAQYPRLTRLTVPTFGFDGAPVPDVRQVSAVTHLTTSFVDYALLHPRLVDLTVCDAPGVPLGRVGSFLYFAFRELPRLASLTFAGDARLLRADCLSADGQDNHVTRVRFEGRRPQSHISDFEWSALARQFPHLEVLELANTQQHGELIGINAHFPHLQSLRANDVAFISFDGIRLPNVVRLEVTGLHCLALDRVWLYLQQGGAPQLRELALAARCYQRWDHDAAEHGNDVAWGNVAATHPHLAVVRLTASLFDSRIVERLPCLDSLRELDVRVGNVADFVASVATVAWSDVRTEPLSVSVSVSDEHGVLAGTLDERGWHPAE